MSDISITKKPHKHADLIKQWADGAEIECRNAVSLEWRHLDMPTWHDDVEYRVKAGVAYPKTRMHDYQILEIVKNSPGNYRDSYLAIANAAIRHAIDAGQVVIAEVRP